VSVGEERLLLVAPGKTSIVSYIQLGGGGVTFALLDILQKSLFFFHVRRPGQLFVVHR